MVDGLIRVFLLLLLLLLLMERIRVTNGRRCDVNGKGRRNRLNVTMGVVTG